MWHAITMRFRNNARSRRVACAGSLESGAGRCVRARGLSCGIQSRRDVVTTQGLGGWRAMAASKVVPRCCLYSRSVHQHLGHGPLSCRQRRLQACFRRCMRARGLSCGMQPRCDVVTTQGLGGWHAMAASKVVPQCCLNSRSIHQHLGHGPLSCRQRRFAGLLWAMHACSRPLMWHAITMRCRHNARSRRVACVGSLESGAAVLSLQ